MSEPAGLRITADVAGKTGKADLIFAEIDFIDKDGNIAWTADGEVTVNSEGGRIIGTGSGKVDDTHDYTQNVCRAYHGRLLAAIIPEAEEIKITAVSEDMQTEASIKTE